MTRFLVALLSAALFLTPAYAQPTLSKAPALKGAPELVAASPVDVAPMTKESPKAEAPPVVAEPAAGYVGPAAGTVTVTVPKGFGVADRGTGAVVWSEAGKSYVVTNKHVVWEKRSPTALTVTVNATGKTYPARFVDWSHEGDVALVELDAELPAVKLGNTAAPGTRITHHGNRTGPQSGSVTSYRDQTGLIFRWSGPVLNSDIVVASGDSGAGMFNDKGELVGVVWGGDHSTNERHGAPVGVVRSLLSRVVANRLPRLAARLKTDHAAAVVSEPGAVVKHTPKSAAACACKGDCVCEPCKGDCPKTAKSAPVVWNVRDTNGVIHRGLTTEEARARFPGVTFPGDAGHTPWYEVNGTGSTGAASFAPPCANGRCSSPGTAPGVTYYYPPGAFAPGSPCANGRCPQPAR